MKLKVDLNKIRKNAYENWNHYKFEDYNNCPFCDKSVTMIGQVNESQIFRCRHCEKEFTLNIISEEIELISKVAPKAISDDDKIYKIEFEVNNGTSFIEDVAFVKARNSVYAKFILKNYIATLPGAGEQCVWKISYIGEDTPSIITGKFGSK